MRETFMLKVTTRNLVKEKDTQREVDNTVYIMCHNIISITPNEKGCIVQTVSHAYQVVETAEQILSQTKSVGTMIVIGASR